jgi:hypothetical protein
MFSLRIARLVLVIVLLIGTPCFVILSNVRCQKDNAVSPNSSVSSREIPAIADANSPSSCLLVGLRKGLIACYPFIRDAKDFSGNGHDGIVSGATLMCDRFHRPKRAYSFDGIDDEIQIPHDPVFDLTGTNALTISCWFRVNKWLYGAGIWCKSAKRGVANYCVSLDPYNKLILIANHYGGGMQENLFTNATFVLNKWYNLTVVFDQKTAKIYVNGSLDISYTYSTPFVPNTGDFFIGNDTDGDNEFLTGCVDDLCIFDRALSGPEIKKLNKPGAFD